MPIPKPSKKESKNDFISKCMGDKTMNKDYPDQAQRAAICYSQWKNKKKKSKAEIKIQGDEIIFS